MGRDEGTGDGGRLPGGPWPVAVGLSLALLGSPALQRLPVPDGLEVSGIPVDNLVMWALAVGVAVLVLIWERRPLASIGLAGLPARTALLAAGPGIPITAVGLLSTGLYVAVSGAEQPPEWLGAKMRRVQSASSDRLHPSAGAGVKNKGRLRRFGGRDAL